MPKTFITDSRSSIYSCLHQKRNKSKQFIFSFWMLLLLFWKHLRFLSFHADHQIYGRMIFHKLVKSKTSHYHTQTISILIQHYCSPLRLRFTTAIFSKIGGIVGGSKMLKQWITCLDRNSLVTPTVGFFLKHYNHRAKMYLPLYVRIIEDNESPKVTSITCFIEY